MTPQVTLTRAEVAALLHLHPRSFDALRRRDGTFPEPFRPGGPKGFPRWFRADVEAWIATRRWLPGPVDSTPGMRATA